MPEASPVRKVINTFFNPLALKSDRYYSATSGKDPLLDAAGHAGALGIGYGGAAMLLRSFLNDIKKKDTGKLKKRVRSNIAASRPIISLDSSQDDAEEEEALQGLGTERLLKEQNFQPFFKEAKEGDAPVLNIFGRDRAQRGTDPDAPSGLWEFVKQLWGSADDSHPWHMAAGLGTAGLGATLGYKAMGGLYDRGEKKDLEKRIADLRNQIDAQSLEAYNESRGIDPELPKEATEGEPQAVTEPDWDNPNTKGFVEKSMYTAGSLYALYAVLTGALGYNFAKKYSDNNDEDRQELANIEEFTKRRALSDKAPQFLNMTTIGSEQQEAPKLNNRKQLQTQSLKALTPPKAELPKAPAATAVDKNDPVAALLNG